MYLLMSLCEKAGIEYRVDSEDNPDGESDESLLEQKARNIAEMTKAKMEKASGIPSGVIPKDIEAKIEEVEVPQESLLTKTEPAPEQPQSLLERGQ